MAKSRKRSARPPRAVTDPHGASSSPTVAGAPLPDLPPDLFIRRLGRALGWMTPSGPLSGRVFALALLGVCIVGAFLRMAWLARVGWGTAEAQWQGVPLLTSADGYFFGSGVDVALHGDTFGMSRFESADSAIVALTWLVAKLLPISLDSAMLYLPVVVAPLVAIPTALLAREVLGARAAVLAALLAVVGPVYARRSVAGYFDTDMFAVTIPLVAVWLLVRLLRRGESRDGLFAGLTLAALPFFYSQGGPVGAAIAATGAGALVLFHRRAPFVAPSLAVLGLSQLPLHWGLRAALLVPVWFALGRLALLLERSDGPVSEAQPPRERAKHVRWLRWAAVAIALAGFALSAEWGAALQKLQIFTGVSGPTTTAAASGTAGLVFPDASTYVSEVQRPDLATLGIDLAGSLPALLVGLLGCVVLLLRYRALLVCAPLVGLGFFALWGGSRFGIYAVPIVAIGLAGAVTLLAQRVRGSKLRLGVTLALAALASVPAAVRVARDTPYIPFLRDEVAPIVALGKLVKPGDVTIAAWDYGYPIGYYARARTLADGGRHAEDAEIIGEILVTSSQQRAAALARRMAEAASRPNAPEPVIDTVLGEARRDLGLTPVPFLEALGRPDLAPVAKTRDVYFFLPARMSRALPTMDKLRPRAPDDRTPEAFAAIAFDVKFHPRRITLSEGRTLDPNAAILDDHGKQFPLKKLFFIQGFGDTLKVLPQDGHPNATTSGVYLQASGIFLELDDRLMDSVFVQLFVFQKADPALFELVYANNVTRIYRLRV